MSKLKNPTPSSERASGKDIVREQAASLDTDAYQAKAAVLIGNPNIFQAAVPEQPAIEVRTDVAGQVIDLAAVQADRENSAQLSTIDRIRHDIGAILDEAA
jgi:hypothetical protein